MQSLETNLEKIYQSYRRLVWRGDSTEPFIRILLEFGNMNLSYCNRNAALAIRILAVKESLLQTRDEACIQVDYLLKCMFGHNSHCGEIATLTTEQLAKNSQQLLLRFARQTSEGRQTDFQMLSYSLKYGGDRFRRLLNRTQTSFSQYLVRCGVANARQEYVSFLESWDLRSELRHSDLDRAVLVILLTRTDTRFQQLVASLRDN